MKIDEKDDFKLEGQIRFKIEKLSEFARAPVGTRRLSNVVFVRGLQWHIVVINRENTVDGLPRQLGYFLDCNVDNPDPDWSCAAEISLKVLSQKEGKEDHVRSFTHVYNAKQYGWGFPNYTSFEHLMAHEYGFYHKKSDTIVLAAEFTVDAQKSTEQINFTNAKPNATIKVENVDVKVNKHALTLSSDYFDKYFFDDRYPPAENIELPLSTTVEDFKRMVATLPPKHVQLDDDCVEAILILADRFAIAMDNVMELGRKFLNSSSSNKPKLFKFRMAHKYGWKEMEEEVLQSMRPADFNFENFLKNAKEYAMMDDDAEAVLSARYAELVSGAKK